MKTCSLFHSFHPSKKIGPTKGILSKAFAKVAIIAIALCSLINRDFYYHKSSSLKEALFFRCLSFTIFGFLLSVFFYTLNKRITLFCN